MYLTGTTSVKDAAKSGRNVTVTYKANVLKVREMIHSDGRYTIHDISSLLAYRYIGVHFILKYEIFLQNGYCID